MKSFGKAAGIQAVASKSSYFSARISRNGRFMQQPPRLFQPPG
jgi:hypothetical protein